ncbi:hypothetical protein RCL1_001863 [Eukaryota sp. TZLM3-RCL]
MKLQYLFLLLLFTTVFAEFRVRHYDFYKTLSVPRNATQEEIKRSFRKMLLQYHPDKAENNEQRKKAEQMFPLINEAYEVLSDPELREELDALLQGKHFVWYSVSGRPIDGKYGFPILFFLFTAIHYIYKYYRYKVNYNLVKANLEKKVEIERKRLSRATKKEEKRIQLINRQNRSSKKKDQSPIINPNEHIKSVREQNEKQLEELQNSKIELKGGVHFPTFYDSLIWKTLIFVPNIVMFFTRLVRYYFLGCRTYADCVFVFRQRHSLSKDAFEAYSDYPIVHAMIKKDMGLDPLAPYPDGVGPKVKPEKEEKEE